MQNQPQDNLSYQRNESNVVANKPFEDQIQQEGKEENMLRAFGQCIKNTEPQPFRLNFGDVKMQEPIKTHKLFKMNGSLAEFPLFTDFQVGLSDPLVVENSI